MPVTQLDWMRQIFRTIGAVTGRDARAQAVDVQLDAGIARNAARLAAAGRKGERVALLQDLGLPDRYWAYTGNSTSAQLARALGARSVAEPTRAARAAVRDRVDGRAAFREARFAGVALRARNEGTPDCAHRTQHLGVCGPMSALKLADVMTDTMLKLPAVR